MPPTAAPAARQRAQPLRAPRRRRVRRRACPRIPAAGRARAGSPTAPCTATSMPLLARTGLPSRETSAPRRTAPRRSGGWRRATARSPPRTPSSESPAPGRSRPGTPMPSRCAAREARPAGETCLFATCGDGTARASRTGSRHDPGRREPRQERLLELVRGRFVGWREHAARHGRRAAADLQPLVMRLYWPRTERPSILPVGEGAWKPPAIEVAK